MRAFDVGAVMLLPALAAAAMAGDSERAAPTRSTSGEHAALSRTGEATVFAATGLATARDHPAPTGTGAPAALVSAGERPRLTISSVALTTLGGGVRVSATVRNAGARRSARSRVTYRLVGRGRPHVLATRPLRALAPEAAARVSAQLSTRRRVLVCVGADCVEAMPAPRIGTRPADPSAATVADFSFSHPWRGVRYACRLDDGTPVSCASPMRYRGLAEGDHRFSVTATRAGSRLSATTVYRWTVDTTAPPVPTMARGPDALSNRRDVEFAFTDADAEATFSCRLDGAPAQPCISPHVVGPLADGPHTFAIEARDPAGNRSEPRTVVWTVDATPPPAPSILSAPAATSADTLARFTFAADEPAPRFSCALDDGAATACSSPVEYHGLAEGDHRFVVNAHDAAGNVATSEREWTIVLRPGAATGLEVTVQETTATVAGIVTPNGKPTTYWVEYGPDTGYGRRSAVAPAGATPVAVPVQALLSGLEPATTYHYRLVATTCGGCPAGTSVGADGTLTTPPARTYTNPVYGGLADPMALRDLGDYYSYGTGDLFPIVHSTDLVHWTKVGTAMSRRPAWVPRSGEWNPWAPSVLRRDGACPGTTSTRCYFMYYTGLNAALSPAANCIGVAVSTSPTGPFTDTGILTTDPPSTDSSGRPLGCGDAAGYSNIDAAPFIDPADGKAYLYLSTGHEASGAWRRTVSVIPLAADMIHATGPRQPLFSMTLPWEGDVVEGPWMTVHDGRYYLLYSGGTFTNASYAMGYAESASPTGPFVKPSAEPILKSTADVIGPGGGSVVTTERGEDWLIYHGRAVLGGARTMRIDRLVWDDTVDPPTLTIRGPTTSPQPRP